MNLSLTLSLAVTLCIALFARDNRGRFSSSGQVVDKDKKLGLPVEQLPGDTKHQASNLPCRLGLSQCPRWVRYRVSSVISAEGPKKQPMVTDQKAFTWPCLPDFATYPIWIWKMASRKIVPEEKLPIDPAHQASNRAWRIGLSSFRRWVCSWISQDLLTEGQKQQPLDVEQKAFNLPCIVDRFWEYFAQKALPRLCVEGSLIIFIVHLWRLFMAFGEEREELLNR